MRSTTKQDHIVVDLVPRFGTVGNEFASSSGTTTIPAMVGQGRFTVRHHDAPRSGRLGTSD
eukprot:1210466-Amphidinium_carterae.1